MGFADFLRDSTPSIDELYNEKLNSFTKDILDYCRYAAEKGNTRYSSYGDRYGLSVKFPKTISSRQLKDIGKKMAKDIEKNLLSEGFKYSSAEVRKITDYVEYREIRFDVSCKW